MRKPLLKRTLLSVLQLAIVSLCLCLPAFAQSPTPSSGKTLSENIAGLAQRAGEMIPKLQSEIESPLLSWFETISIVLAALIVMFSFARLWRENNGAGADVFWRFGRLAVCLALLGSGPFIINYLNSIGKQIAQGNELIGDSALSRFYHAQRDSFNDSYQKFTEGLFTVKVNGQDVPVKPGPNGTDVGPRSSHEVSPPATLYSPAQERNPGLTFQGAPLAFRPSECAHWAPRRAPCPLRGNTQPSEKHYHLLISLAYSS